MKIIIVTKEMSCLLLPKKTFTFFSKNAPKQPGMLESLNSQTFYSIYCCAFI